MILCIRPSTSKKLEGHTAFGLSIRDSVHPSITLFDACHILRTVHAGVVKFYIWIPDEKIADRYFFSCPSYVPFWS